MPYKEKRIEDLKIYWSISEIAKELGITTSMIRYWENQIPEIKPRMRDKRMHRKYTKVERQRVSLIYDLIKNRRYTLTGARIQFIKLINL